MKKTDYEISVDVIEKLDISDIMKNILLELNEKYWYYANWNPKIKHGSHAFRVAEGIKICMDYLIDINQSTPKDLESVLALIRHQGDLGISEWYEVVYYCDKWHSYRDSKTFEDGEKVVKWKYTKDCF